MSVETRINAFSARHPIAASLLRLRFTLLFLAVMLAANLLAGSLAHVLPDRVLLAWGVGHDSVLSGELFRLVTGIFLSHDPGMFARQFAFAAAIIGYTEWMRGSSVAALLFFGLDLIGTLILLACVGWGAGVIDLTSANDVGMSIGGFALFGVAIAGWRYRGALLCLTLLAIAVKLALAPDLLADGGHVLALLLGFSLGCVLPPPADREANHER